MESIKLYATALDYETDKVNLPTVHVTKSEDDGVAHYGGMKEVIDNPISEEIYGTAVFDVFREQGWIAQDVHIMTKKQAASITYLNKAFLDNDEIEDATFLKYFTSLAQFPNPVGFIVGGFNDCNNLKKVIIPNVPIYNAVAFRGCPLEYIEFSEGITTIPSQFCPNANTTIGLRFVLPSTLVSIGNSTFAYCGLETVDLRHTSLTTIGSSFIYYGLNCKEVYFPETLTSLGESFARRAAKLEYIEFNSTTSLTIGENCYARENNVAYSPVVINFKNNIPITIGNVFGGYNRNKCIVIFHSTTVPTIGTSFFLNSSTTEIYVPVGCVSQYEATENYSRFVGRIYEIGGEEWTAAGLDKYNS